MPNIGPDTTLCAGQSVTVTLPPVAATRYQWQDGSTALSRTFTQPGTYVVSATTGDYTLTDTLNVRLQPPLTLPVDTVLCRGETLLLAPADVSGPLLWSDGSREATLSVTQAGTYWVQAPTSHCALADTIRVAVADCPDPVPNVFTPNGDGKNETFMIGHIEGAPWRLEVYNRWGRRVHIAAEYHNDWRAEGLPAGLYYYYLSSETLRRSLKGWVEVLR